MNNITPACNADSIFRDAIVKFLITADKEELTEIFMECAVHSGEALNKIYHSAEETMEGYIEAHEVA